jgi:phosphoserine phosphatase RsbU/P
MNKKGFRLPFAREEDPPGDELGTLREENRQLKRAVEELSILNELSRAIGASVDSQDIIHKIVDRSMRAVQAEQTVVTLVDRNANEPMKTLVRAMTSSTEHPHYHLNENLIGWMHLYKKPLLTNDPTSDERFSGLKLEQSIHSILCVPLMVKSALIGVITSYNKKGRGFNEEDQRLLAIIAGQSAQIIENARLYEEEKALVSMKEQVKLAAQIQLDLLPKSPPQLEGYDIAACSIAAQMVGGDYYDFVRAEDGRWAVCLGDVSGKGLPASLLMANLQATLRGQTAILNTVSETIARSNRLIYQSTDPEKFATLFYGVLDAPGGGLAFCNAGHEYPMLFKSGAEAPTRLVTGGMALGVLEEFPYEEGATRMDPGDTLIVYSDGITDAVNEFEQPFGEERLRECVRKHAADSAVTIMERVVEAVKAHERGTPRIDDLTLLVVKRNA